MSFFLFIKQFVDMLYPYQFLDYGMVVLVILLLGYQVALVRPDIRHHISVTDGIMLGLGVLLTFSWFRSGEDIRYTLRFFRRCCFISLEESIMTELRNATVRWYWRLISLST